MKDLDKRLLKISYNFLRRLAEFSNDAGREIPRKIWSVMDKIKEYMYTDKELEEQKERYLQWLENLPSPQDDFGPNYKEVKNCNGCKFLVRGHENVLYKGKEGIEFIGPSCNSLKITLNYNKSLKLSIPSNKCPY